MSWGVGSAGLAWPGLAVRAGIGMGFLTHSVWMEPHDGFRLCREEDAAVPHGHITSLAVLRTHRKCGIATRLMQASRE